MVLRVVRNRTGRNLKSRQTDETREPKDVLIGRNLRESRQPANS
jgi:hypothetical protein